ncbi:MAG: C4-dicarboxylate ABC transporter permease, partial [Gammaproteobacteria bacterium]|nr:C4-dicarboxylate ABC transporter permease [Gammaproteobacteria bacterium]MBU1467677.1 C4-dicarboxylate ABC transporter permease [Gammaproteobacteria bacterium]MBU2413693.1 C4-dicarboxylate ABC transporter permease [Gammaproteobacteria bacterium]
MNTESSTQEVVIHEPAMISVLRNGLGVLIALAAIAFAADLFSRLGIAIYTEQYLAVILGISLALVFLKPQSSQLKRSLNGLLALLGLITSLYLAVQYPDLVERQLDLPLDALAVSVILFVLVLEGLRRVVGLTLVIVVMLFMVFALLGSHLSGPLQTRDIDLDRLFVYLGVDTNGM